MRIGAEPFDGIFGPATALVLKRAQCDCGLQPTGVADNDTLLSLGIPVYAGIDVSHHQGAIDWTQVGRVVGFAFIKATEAVTHDDKLFQANRTGAVLGGVPAAPYHFARPDRGNTARAEFEHFQRIVGRLLPCELQTVGLDIEKWAWSKKTTVAQRIDWLDEWCDRAAQWTGERTTLYVGTAFLHFVLRGGKRLSKSALLWSKDYKYDPSTKAAAARGWFGDRNALGNWDEYTLWQVGQTRCPGIKGDVDLNYSAGGALVLDANGRMRLRG